MSSIVSLFFSFQVANRWGEMMHRLHWRGKHSAWYVSKFLTVKQ